MSEDMKTELAASALAGLSSQAEPTADQHTGGKYDANSCGEPMGCGIDMP